MSDGMWLSVQIFTGSSFPLAFDGTAHTFADVRSFSMRRGKSSELDGWDPGDATVTIADPDGVLDPLVGTVGVDVLPMSPVRVSLELKSGFTTSVSAVFTGFAVDGPQPDRDPLTHDQVVTLTLTDWIGAASAFDVASSQWSYFVAQSLGLVAWIPGDGDDTAAVGSMWQKPVFIGAAWQWPNAFFPTSYSPTPTNGPSIVPDDDARSLVLRPGVRTQGPLPPATVSAAQWTVAVWVEADDIAHDQTIAMGLDGSANLAWRISLLANGTVAATGVNTDGSTYYAVSSVSVPHDDGETHLIVAQFNTAPSSATVTLTTDLDGNSVGTNPAGKTPRRMGATIVAGEQTNVETLRMSHLAVWNSLTPFGSGAAASALVAGLVAGTADIGRGETVDTRVRHLTASPFVQSPAVVALLENPSVVTGTPTMSRYSAASNLGDAVARLGPSFLGAAYMRRDGTLLVRSSIALTNPAYTDFTGPGTPITDDPDAVGAVRASGRDRSGPLLDRVINEVDATFVTQYIGEETITRRDVISQRRYGIRKRQIDSDADYANYGIATLDAFVARFKDPSANVGDVAIKPLHSAPARVFFAAELEQTVVYTASRPYAAPVYDAVAMRINRIEWDWSAGVDWTITLGLEPA